MSRLTPFRFATPLVAVAVAALLLGDATPARAEIIDVPWTITSDTFSNDDLGAAINVRTLLDFSTYGVGPNSALIGLGWNVSLYADPPSWLSELAIFFSDSTQTSPDSFFLRPGIGNNTPGFGSYNSGGVILLSSAGLNPLVLPNGQLYVEFFETFVDYPNDWDGIWFAGSTFTLRYSVPEPSAPMLIATGAGVLFLARGARRLGRKFSRARVADEPRAGH